ncbi:guanine nucleotide-binding protein alpha-1 subunit [Meredithblackwellia eburnea MCA 4105]
MGCAGSTEDKAGAERNAAIEAELRRDKAAMNREVKLLFLGAGESGKSTVIKQMRLRFKGTFSEEEREGFKEVIFSNSAQSMQVVIDAMEMLALEVPSHIQQYFDTFITYDINTVITTPGGDLAPQFAMGIKAIWNERVAKECVARGHEYQLNDSASYFFDSIDRIASPGYIPTDDDVLRARVRSTGIAESSFDVGQMKYRCFDVGGQRSERRKWAHCFEDVQVLIFIVAISEYNQMLYEDESIPRLKEATTLWDSIANSRWFTRTSIILFLNKIDLFRNKLENHKFGDYVLEYQGANSYSAVSTYLIQHFHSLYRNPSKELFIHLTCATDSSQTAIVLSAVNEQILRSLLVNSGIM